MQNHFELFGLPIRFALDEAALDAAYRVLQNQVHPDKFVSAGAAEKRVALQWATRANEAHQTLRNPLQRAAYLCALRGVDLQTESNTTMASSFLMQQMEWREALDEARAKGDVQALESLHDEVHVARRLAIGEIGPLLDAANPAKTNAAAQGIRQLMFLEKLGFEIDEAGAHIDAC